MKISKTTSKQARAQQLVYDVFTNNGVVGIETEDRDRLNLHIDFQDVFNLGIVRRSQNRSLNTN